MPLNEMLSNAAKKGAAIQQFKALRMCDDCAFKKGTDANNDEVAVEAAADCLAFYGTFNCHSGSFEDAGTVCVGFRYAKQYFESIGD